MLRIIYCLLLLVISICSRATVIWLLSFIGLLLVAGACFVAFASSVTLAEELVEWPQRSIAGPRTIAAACLLRTRRHMEMRKMMVH
jgi:hypothetical protein